MTIKLFPKTIVGKISIILGLLTPVINFVSFAIDSTEMFYVIVGIMIAWLATGIVALLKKDWTIMTILSVIIALITLTQLRF